MAYTIQSNSIHRKNVYLDSSATHRVGLQSKVGLQTLDKLIVLCLVALAVAASGVLVSKYVTASELNYQKQELQQQIATFKEVNTQLEMKIAELSSPERIYEIAVNDIGMSTASPENVKIVQRVRVAEVESYYGGNIN
ncbi:cell division protein FtsL [Desulfuribacillus alkaliarsenatis]|uniref:Cell division protein FtsL n=1 Tax=Desulfuribacillus alkaliarsenatis TaxID=766136 RepID=A0A1E5FZX6_9FIRM|nr:cell division protein FtsL [Desulfuribacillus alkaliarsenatis]OEF96080.1 cell division protein FtsL [Desulfuribacillus alkaliarsenatis]